MSALVFIFGTFYRLEEEEDYQEDPEDPDFIEGQEEDFAEGKSYLSLTILNPWFTDTSYRACFNYLYCMFILKCCLVNSYYCYCHALIHALLFHCKTLEGPQQQLYCLFGCYPCLLNALLCFIVDTLAI